MGGTVSLPSRVGEAGSIPRGPGLSCVAELCLLQGKHGGFERERRSNAIFLDPLPFREFAFQDMPDAGQVPSAPDGPLSVLKQGIASRVGHGELMAS